MTIDINWELIAKFLSGECSPAEIEIVQEWINKNKENENAFESIKKIWDTPEEKFESSDINALWRNVTERTGLTIKAVEQPVFTLPEKETVFIKIPLLLKSPLFRYAAIFLLMLSASLIYIFFDQSGFEVSTAWNSVHVKSGKQDTITLPDGSKIVADAGSILQYQDNFGEGLREVKLQGEAFFEVTRNPDRPFKVFSGNSVVEVLGTKFNVRAWPEAGKILLAVVEGRVSFESVLQKEEKVVLEKGFGSNLSKNGKISSPYPVDETIALSWLKGEIYFENASLSEVLSQLERWFDITVVLSDKSIESERLSVYIQNKTLTDNLNILSKLTGTQYSISNNVVKLKINN